MVRSLRRHGRSLLGRVEAWRHERDRQAAIAAWSEGRALPADGPGTITLARIVGNDLYPRHADGQALRNIQFILDREPDFPGCRKLFVLNRILDEATLTEAERLVTERGHSVLVIPFSAGEYAAQPCDTSDFGGDRHFLAPAPNPEAEKLRDRERLWACRAKICYAINVNGARNAALDWGRRNGDWTLVLDGSCFVAQAAWDRIRADMSRPPFVPYLIVPMHRLPSNDDVDRIAPEPNRVEEPQIAIHSSAQLRFDERYPYALRNKTALFERIGVPGPWDAWVRLPWLPKPEGPTPERLLYKFADTCVFRLSSGIHDGALEHRDSHKRRHVGRTAAVMRTLAMLDERFGAPDRDRARRIMGLSEEEFPTETES